MGMVGGGEGSFIGAIHRMAAALDGEIELVAGCFSTNSERNKLTGASLNLSPERTYTNYESMMEVEVSLPENERIQFVAIVTPNHLHFPIAKSALAKGFHVLCDKPVATDLNEALELKKQVENAVGLFGLTHTYAAYPMIREARSIIASGELGEVRRISVSYPQGWLSDASDTQASPQSIWRTDPEKCGESGCFGDIGTHAHHLIEYVTGIKMIEVCADLITYIDWRALDDDGAALFRMENGARGTLMASQICAGEGNDFQITVYCGRGSLSWHQESPNELIVKPNKQPMKTLKAGVNCSYLSTDARSYCRAPEDHPEGYIEAFANIYRDFARAIKKEITKKDFPSFASIEEGVRGMAFVRAVLHSSHNNSVWTTLKFDDAEFGGNK